MEPERSTEISKGKRPVYFITNYARLTKTRGKERNKKPIDKMNDSITDSVQ